MEITDYNRLLVGKNLSLTACNSSFLGLVLT